MKTPSIVSLTATIIIAAATAQVSAQDVTFTDAERVPLSCDNQFTVNDLATLKPTAPDDEITIAVSVPSFANPYIQSLIYGAEKAAKEVGVKLTVGAGRGFMDPGSQISQLESAATRRPDAVLINPADPAGLAAAIDDVVASGIPVVDIGTLSMSENSYKLVQDDYSQGQVAAKAVIEHFQSGGKGVIVAGPANASWSRGRTAGFTDALADSSIEVSSIVWSDLDPQQALTRFSNAIQTDPEVDWIYATGSFLLAPQSLPAEYADTFYLGGTLTNVSAAGLQEGTANLILPDFPVAVGYLGVVLALKALAGEDLAKVNCLPNEVMGKDNLEEPVWSDASFVPADWKAPE
ncbi:sugar ABC transporter substrate-binding protein [Sulfitobacter geojensis]|uniref:sugar ABC transporter substrate-binding protein n=1 Tax=Sulfitobacter geojensis TaxID=1342299 RepID=UPI000469185B|nr:sugar ABC transporter substrate-binding protein [Sulfitobacter geojensis]KHA54094.1 ABC transporter substrate-binding protein [Sulfitobacter geojensis]NYI29912.1 ribose transport system substrate-binding protein [Sulfitobacter geojensis]